MTALAGSYDPKRKDGELIRYPLAAGAHVFKGALVSVISTTGYAAPGADATGTVCVGVAFEEGNNSAGGVQYDGSISSGAAGAVGVRVHRIKHLLCWLQTELRKPFALAYNVVELEGRNAAAVGGSGS